MKKAIRIICIFTLLALLLTACATKVKPETTDTTSGSDPTEINEASLNNTEVSEQGSEEPTEDSWDDEEMEDWEWPAPYDYFPMSAHSFVNDKVLTTSLTYNGQTYDFEFGAKSSFENGFIVNPKCKQADAKYNIMGYYCYCTDAIIITEDVKWFDQEEEYPNGYGYIVDDGYNNFLIESSFKHLRDPQYISTKTLGLTVTTDTPDEIDTIVISVRPINMHYIKMLGILHLYLEKQSDGKFHFTKIVNGEETDQSIRDAATKLALECFHNEKEFHDYRDATEEKILIEKLEKNTYFPYYCQPGTHYKLYSGLTAYPVYAVTVNNDDWVYGWLTFYVGLERDENWNPTGGYTLLGYDTPRPRDDWAEEHWYSWFQPDQDTIQPRH